MHFSRCGLRLVQDILDGVEDIHFSLLTSVDVVRHKLVSDIVDAYSKWDESQNAPHALPARAAGGRAGRRR